MGNRVKEIRKRQKITQVELSKITKIAQNQISLIENDLKTCNVETAKTIARALGHSVETLWPD